MPGSPHLGADALRSVRIQEILRLLAVKPLPAKEIERRLNRILADKRLPGVVLRTVQLDLRWLEEADEEPPIERVSASSLPERPGPELAGHRIFYRLRDGDDIVLTPPQPGFISGLEALALAAARAQFAAPPTPGTTDEGPLASALARLLRRLGLEEPGRVPDILGVTLSAPQPWQPAHALACLHAIRAGDSLTLKYAPVGKSPHEITVQPVRMMWNDGEPYVWAWDPAAQKLKTFKLARVTVLSRGKGLPQVPSGLAGEVKAEVRRLFQGFTHVNSRGRVTLRFTAAAVPLVRDRRLGGVQEQQDLPDGGLRITFNTAGLDAVARWVLQFGPEVLVELPISLIAQVRDQARRTAALYNE
jgi:predicted DNA-binding transcriptional regulator YafY